MTRTLFALMTMLAVVGCEGPGDSKATLETDTGEPVLPPEPPLLNGLFLTGMTVAPVAGLVQPLQIEVAMTRAEDGTRTVDTIILRASDGDEAVSEDLTTVTDIVVNDDDTFTVDWSLFVLSSEFSPTGNPVEIEAVMEVTIQDDSSFCGTVTGTIVSFDMDLVGSTFGARPWEDRILGLVSSCDGRTLEDLPRIETCPEISDGINTGFSSGDQEREFEVAIPEDYDASGSYPLVFGYHGLSGNGPGFMDDTNLRAQASLNNSIIVAPSAMVSGTAVFDPIGDPEYNHDIVFFDDLLTCISEQYSVDASRVHVTGMSLGGLFTGTLITTRSDVIASAAPFSGGIWRNKVEGSVAIPSLVSWGGPEDTAQGQDFNALGQEMAELLVEDGHPVFTCNHMQGHEFESDFWTWTFRFFTDHPQGAATPYTAGLPSEFPSYCEVASTGS